MTVWGLSDTQQFCSSDASAGTVPGMGYNVANAIVLCEVMFDLRKIVQGLPRTPDKVTGIDLGREQVATSSCLTASRALRHREAIRIHCCGVEPTLPAP